MRFNHYAWLPKRVVEMTTLACLLAAIVPSQASAAGDDLNVQVSPSPLTVSVTPGQVQTATITVRNFSNHPETLRPHLSGFHIDASSQNIKLEDTVPLGLNAWISFKEQSLTIQPGASQPLDVVYNTPTNVGFSYALAVVLSRADEQPVQTQGARLRGKVAVFNLINVNRPDAKRQLNIAGLTTTKSHYQFLPVDFTIMVKNEGNVIDQPRGTLFIQRTFDSNTPIAAIPINQTAGYILPGATRALAAQWKDGFPAYIQSGASGNTFHLSWDWKHVGSFRFGRYTAKLVLVYNDGHRDVPLVASKTFWVIPWWLLIITVVILVILMMGVVTGGQLIVHGTKKVKGYAHKHH